MHEDKEDDWLKEAIDQLKSETPIFDEIKNALRQLQLQEPVPEGGLPLRYSMEDGSMCGSNLLHIALKHQVDSDIIKYLINKAPYQISEGRISKFYKGQTPFHMAIVQGKIELVTLMVEKVPNKIELFKTTATGSKFKNNVMMGQIPLSVAVLSFNFRIVTLLLKQNAEIAAQNNDGDTVFHSLIRYAAIHPEKIAKIVHMFAYLKNHLDQHSPKLKNLDEQNNFKYTNQFVGVWFLKNQENLTALQLAGKHRVPEIFEFIYGMKNVYHFVNEADGLTDVKTFDITDIDPPSHYESEEEPQTVSVSEMLSHGHHNINSVFRIITRPPFKQLIEKKWSTYRALFILLMCLHFGLISICTIFAVMRREHSAEKRSVGYLAASSVSSGIFGISYGGIVVITIMKKKLRFKLMKNKRVAIMHHFGYIVLLFTCSVSFLVDIILNLSGIETDIFMIIALVSGWWFSVFFLSPFRRFSFFTVMMRRVFFGDFLRFFIIMSFELISFTSAMYLLFLPSDSTTSDDQLKDFGGYFQTMLTMFKLMIGLGDIEILYDAKMPGLAIFIFVIFVITTYILMVNALIAMMSNTCTQVSQEKYPQWRIQQLSAILALEDIFANFKYNLMEAEKKTLEYMNKECSNTVEHIRFFITTSHSEIDEATDEYRYLMEQEKRTKFDDSLFTRSQGQQISPEAKKSDVSRLEQPEVLEDSVDSQLRQTSSNNTNNCDSSTMMEPRIHHINVESCHDERSVATLRQNDGRSVATLRQNDERRSVGILRQNGGRRSVANLRRNDRRRRVRSNYDRRNAIYVSNNN